MKMNNIEKLLIKRSNATKEEAKAIDDSIAFQLRDTNWTFSNQDDYEIPRLLNSLTSKIEDNQLTFEQDSIYKEMLSNKNIFVSAKTSFGKTWLSYMTFITRISRLESFLDKRINYVHLVPSDIIATQVISKVNKVIKEKNLDKFANASDQFTSGTSNYVVGTPEKLYSYTNRKFKHGTIDVIIFDEAHEMFFNSERSVFYHTTAKQFMTKFKEAQCWFIGAFLTDENKKEINEILKSGELVCFKPTGFKSMYTIEYDNSFYLKSEEVDEYPTSKGVSLYYFRSVQACEDAFDLHVRSPMKYLQHADVAMNNFAQYNEMTNKIDEVEKYFHIDPSEEKADNNYNVLDGLRVGIALYHAKMPEKVKRLVYEFAENGWISKIYSTSAIISGLDLEIDEIIITDLSMGGEAMEVDNFFNLAGRSGRYRPKRQQVIANVKVESNVKNNKWMDTNKDRVIKRIKRNKLTSKLDDADLYNISATLKKIQEKDTEPYLKEYLMIDPRIHPNITIKLLEDERFGKTMILNLLKAIKIVQSDNKIRKKETNKLSEFGNNIYVWTRWDEIKPLIDEFLKLYSYKEYKFKRRFILHNYKPNHKKTIETFFNYVLLKDENMIFKNYSYGIKNNYGVFSVKMRRQAELFYNEVKYALFSYYSHALSVGKRKGWIDEDLNDIFEKGK